MNSALFSAKVLIILIFSSISLASLSQSEYSAVLQLERDSTDQSFIKNASPEISALVKENGGLNYLPISGEYVVEAEFILIPDAEEVVIKTKLERVSKIYIPHATLRFELLGKEYELTALREQASAEPKFVINDEGEMEKITVEEELESLFLGFTDLTSGTSTYGGGRYLDLELKDVINEKFLLDFNKSYNPACAYYDNTVCLIPPSENFLNLNIEAVIKSFAH